MKPSFVNHRSPVTFPFYKSSPPARQGDQALPLPSESFSFGEAQTDDRSHLTLGALAIAGLGLLTACKQAPPVPVAETVQETVNKNQCSLVLIDSFNGSHGPTVERTSRELGPIPYVHRLSQNDKVDGELPFRAITRQFGREFGSNEMGGPEASARLDQYIVDLYAQPMNLLTSLMQDSNALGVSNSALNISLGLNKLHMVSGAESHLSNSVYRGNIDRALGLNPRSTDSRERKQALLDRVDQVLANSDTVQQAGDAWQREVQLFESNHNSVIVSAGNDGGEARALRRQGYRLSTDADQNFLAFPDVTVVGATTGRLRVADYSRQGNEVDLYASGAVSFTGQGTSFAAPRVAAAMRAGHCQNPELNSEQVERLVLDQLTSPFQVDGQTEQALDLGRVEQFILAR